MLLNLLLAADSFIALLDLGYADIGNGILVKASAVAPMVITRFAIPVILLIAVSAYVGVRWQFCGEGGTIKSSSRCASIELTLHQSV